MWISTYDGLNRYDGSTVRIFRNIWGDNTSLNNNHSNKVTGYGNRIFVGTQKGPVYYDYASSRFFPMLYRTSPAQQPQKINFTVKALMITVKQEVFIGTEDGGLFIGHVNDSLCIQLKLAKLTGKYTVQAITADASGAVWVFIRDVGLCTYQRANGRLKIINAALKSANCLFSDSNGHIWIGTNDGIFQYNRLTGIFSKYLYPSEKLTSDNVMDIRFSQSHELWVGTNGGGINIIDTLSRKIRYITSTSPSGFSLHSDAISMVYLDDESRAWIATLRGGVNIIDNKKPTFKLITHDPFNKNSLVNNFILSFCEDEAQNLWIGTDGGGLSFWNRKINKFTNFSHTSDHSSLSSNFVVSIVNDHSNQIWAATFTGGIDKFDKLSGTFKHYTCSNPFTKTTDRNLWKLYVDSGNTIWAGTTSGGALYYYNRITDKFEVLDSRLTNIHAIYQDHSGTIWAGDYSNLIRLDLSKRNHQFISVKNAVRSITEDLQNHLWIGTEGGGLLRYGLADHLLTRFTQADGLPSNSLLNVVADNRGNIWGSTFNGLTEYTPHSGKFKNYFAADGLQSNQFNFNAAIRLKSGELAFGGINGFNLFFPDSIKVIDRQPPLTVTGLHINNQNIEGYSSYTGTQAIVDLKKITVPYNEATLAVDYTALEYAYPDKVLYSYYLEGWDHGWNNVGQLKTAYYTRLNEGTYTLRIRCTRTDGYWGSRQLLLYIVVLPPAYRTWWAYLLYVCLIGSLIYWFWLYRIKETKLKYEVEIANLKVEREKKANERKLSFFTNVSHEFRTPLTLIINPIKDILQHARENTEELNIVYRNAKRLLGLLDHLLLFRKTESENAVLNVSKVNFTELCREVYNCFTHQAKIKQVNYTFDASDDLIEIYLDMEKIEIALFNLISNALKFTPEGGTVNITIKENETSACFEIADSGIGIKTDVGEKLFDKFYQVKDANSLKTGFGIGLYLVKTFIEHHHGDINYTATNGGGATFNLCLPKGKEHLKDYPITDSTGERYSYAAEELIDYDNPDDILSSSPAVDLALLISDRQSVLVIDDNQEIRNYIRKIFSTDYLVYEASNGEEGLELISKNLPDVIISDIVMPGLSGLELCKRVKQDSALSHIPIILLTGESAPAARLQGIEEGAVDFISKPFDKDLLIARVKGIIKNKTELQKYFYSEITLKGKSRNISEEHKDFLYKCMDIIENSLTDTELEVNTLAGKMGMSYSNLYKKIRAVTGYTLNGFIRFVRLRKAAELMINTNCNVNEAAFHVGFNDVKYFREHFYKQFGINPSEFIKRHRTAFQKNYSIRQRGSKNN